MTPPTHFECTSMHSVLAGLEAERIDLVGAIAQLQRELTIRREERAEESKA